MKRLLAGLPIFKSAFVHSDRLAVRDKSLMQGKHRRGLVRHVAFGKAYLPGTGATVITKAVPPGRGLPIALRWADPCDRPKCGRLGCVIFTQGDCVRAIPYITNSKTDCHLSTLAQLLSSTPRDCG